MKCTNPITLYRLSDGSISPRYEHTAPVDTIAPCGKCFSCRRAKAQEWSLRCRHEAMFHTKSSFVTLTYSDPNLPWQDGVPSLRYKDVQNFFKRLRKAGYRFTYICAGEYGDRTSRPHYHAVFFGLDLSNAELASFWGLGHVDTRSFGPNDCAGDYVAQYTTKKLVCENRDYPVEPFLRVSQGFGKRWFFAYYKHVLKRRFCTQNGFRKSIPRYYLKLAKKYFLDFYVQVWEGGMDIPPPIDLSKFTWSYHYAAELSAIEKYKLKRTKYVKFG